MLVSKIACPQCRVVLRPPRPLPVGQKVQCSGCGTYFLVGPEAPETAPPPAGQGVRAFNVAVAPPARPAVSPPLPGPEEAPPLPPGKNWGVLALILGGALVLLGAGTYLLIASLSGGGKSEKQNQVADNTKQGTGDNSEDEPPPEEKAPAEKRPGGEEKPSGEKKAGPTRPEEAWEPLSRTQQARVNQAIDRGVAYLKSTQGQDGTWGVPRTAVPHNEAERRLPFFQVGMTSLAGLTLLECNVPKDDPAVQKVAGFLRRREATPAGKIKWTYNLSLAILFLDRLGDPKDRELIRNLALRLVAAQKPSGGWFYNSDPLNDAETQALLELLKKHQDLLSPLELKHVEVSKLSLDGLAEVPARIKNLAVWQDDVQDDSPPQKADNSNTQFAILALWAAKAYDVPLQRTLALIVKHFRKTQRPDGSWAYRPDYPAISRFPTMTCAGLLGLAVGLGLTNEAQGKAGPPRVPADQDPQVRKGLDLVARSVDNPHEPWKEAAGAPLIDMYFLWSVERVGVIFHLPKLGGKDWYGWGAEKLIANQKEKGSWENGQYSASHPVVDTCFALLFLKRANLAKDLTAKLRLGD